MIFVEDPFFNEPGYERHQGTASGREQSRQYNEQVRGDTLSSALLPAVEMTCLAFSGGALGTFSEALTIYFRFKRESIHELVDLWLSECQSPAIKDKMNTAITRIRSGLSHLA